ncbi:peptide ABC transporter [Devosia pacifica]|uniref:Peptide ABC transporter n=1 Tax=Devosia pacifica TaxID=1335967 RepID=A0A918VRZ3_9HYPH|nr:ATP-binding cassette domain-containing protein [Devosia pacifica]GHA23859.1 peptide ABC transporter [Devosia pacifica]
MLEGRDLSFGYAGTSLFEQLSLAVPPRTIVGLTGRSGRGKSSLGRILAGHLRPSSGTVVIDGQPRKCGALDSVQYLHQTPIFAFNPRWRIERILSEAWPCDADTRRSLEIPDALLRRYPHELSGGELQRVAVLRALAPGVRYLIADEITAALDPITQARLWRVLQERVADGLGILAISHDRALLQRIAGTVRAL